MAAQRRQGIYANCAGCKRRSWTGTPGSHNSRTTVKALSGRALLAFGAWVVPKHSRVLGKCLRPRYIHAKAPERKRRTVKFKYIDV